MYQSISKPSRLYFRELSMADWQSVLELAAVETIELKLVD